MPQELVLCILNIKYNIGKYEYSQFYAKFNGSVAHNSSLGLTFWL
jgi:hypothetical protein